MNNDDDNNDAGGGLLDTVTAAHYLGRSPATLAQWRYFRHGPDYVKKANGRVGYRREDLDEWVAA